MPEHGCWGLNSRWCACAQGLGQLSHSPENVAFHRIIVDFTPLKGNYIKMQDPQSDRIAGPEYLDRCCSLKLYLEMTMQLVSFRDVCL